MWRGQCFKDGKELLHPECWSIQFLKAGTLVKTYGRPELHVGEKKADTPTSSRFKSINGPPESP